MKLNQFMYALFLGCYLLRVEIPEHVGKYVMKNDFITSNTSLSHLFLFLKNGDLSSNELRNMVIGELK